jgi:23S rRNA (guanosine2251-2'-O)-methyltransferase
MKNHRKIVVIAHNLRSTHNIGSLLRTAEGLGVTRVYLTGYTPYPKTKADTRLPYLAEKIHKQISKTALSAEESVDWQYQENIFPLIEMLKSDGYKVVALEQTPASIKLPDYSPPDKIAIVLGREVEGLEKEVLGVCDLSLEIPMFGKKESFNVVQAAAMALYHCRFS